MPPNDDDDLINFDIIEGHKENIQALPSGRSAKKLAQLFSPRDLLQPQATPPTSLDMKDENNAIRAEFEAELEAMEESDDPLDIYDRYIKWTLDAYPSAQATKESGLVGVLERATRQFAGEKRYRNDGRYLRMWVHYINLFSDAPRETFVFLSSKGIGEGLALYYEEYAGWLEGAGRWAQAEEVFKLGIEREAAPAARLLRKFGEFEKRRALAAERDGDGDGPSSPALPAQRKVLGVRADPFAAAAAAVRNPQAPRQTSGVGGGGSKPAKSKLAIFSDVDAAPGPSAMSSRGPESKGWDSIGSMAERKKENTIAPTPWAGETLKAGGKKPSAGGAKLAVFRDPSMDKQISQSHIRIDYTKVQVTVNPANGKRERIYVDLRAVYPTPDEPGTEKSFEELWAANRGWLDQEWEDEPQHESTLFMNDENSFPGAGNAAAGKGQKMAIHADVIRLDENGAPIYPNRADKPKKKKKVELNETQISRFMLGLLVEGGFADAGTVQTNFDSPSGPKIKKKKKRQSVGEPTMTLHTKAATDDIYDIFNAPAKPVKPLGEDSDDERGYESDDYTLGDGATRNITTSDVDDDEDDEDVDDAEGDSEDNASEWSESSHRQHQDQSDDLIDVHDGEEDELPDEPPRTRTMFVPIPPEDYVPTRRPWRDPVEAANNRLPFMTPITERTEMSLDVTADMGRYELHSKTPSRQTNKNMIAEEDEEEEEDLTPLSSPVRDVFEDENGFPKNKLPQPLLPKPKPALASKPLATKVLTPKVTKTLTINNKGPIIKDTQCNPVDNAVRAEILSNIHPPLTSYEAFYDHRNEQSDRGSEIRKYCKAIGKGGNRSSTGDKSSHLGSSVVLRFPDTEGEYSIRRELGAGAFAPVYLVSNSHSSSWTSNSDDENDNNENAIMGKGRFASAHHKRYPQEALKMESPPTPWEFYIMRLAHSRLGPHDRATASLSPALEFHLYHDECFLFLPYHPFGTLLDVVNLFRSEALGVMDEQLAMFFTIELLRTVEALHSKGIMHGDLKADNCLLRLPSSPDSSPLSNKYQPDGSGGWSSRGVTLIDFGRGIDMRSFRDDVQFAADWKTTSQDCNEVREGRLWTWQIEYFGLAGIVHCLLFGKYIETVRQRGEETGMGKRYKIRENLKRYWQTEIWGGLFEMLLNPGNFTGGEQEGRMPLLKGLKGYRERMEQWLEQNGERGVGLRGLVGRVEGWARGRR
ncbi:putative checkpoint serine/threonine-protein kinase [Triangularia setosa]|uniref:Checkpoint serine/threonine-protein kinase n=1 Tax=Triangularia setosa TaxID=2587417 RepID=A0AAN6W4E9_9PEZI|nr:putative checkpoint serine/threonine-protein kinase [Podospora setosa]